MEHNHKNYLPDIPPERLRWLGVDLDKTLAEGIWPEAGIGPIKPKAKEAMNKLIAKGYKIIIYTARGWDNYEAIDKWCKDNELVVRDIICGKPLFRWMIDDKNIEFDGDWDKVVDRLPEIKIIKPNV